MLNLEKRFEELVAPFRAKLEAEQVAEQAATHEQLAGERATIEQSAADSLARLEPQRRKTVEVVAKAKGTYEAAVAEEMKVAREIVEVKHQRAHGLARLDRRLLATADPRIDAAMIRMNQRLEGVRKNGVQTDEVLREEQRIGGDPFTRRSNFRAFERCSRAVVAARHHLDQLKLAAVDDLPAAIVAIEQTVPWDDLQRLEPFEEGPGRADMIPAPKRPAVPLPAARWPRPDHVRLRP